MKRAILTVLLAVATMALSAATMTLSVAKTKSPVTITYTSASGDEGKIIIKKGDEYKLNINDNDYYTFVLKNEDGDIKYFYLDSHVKWISMHITFKMNERDTYMYGRGYDLHYGGMTKNRLTWVAEYFPIHRTSIK